ncbi:unnamed protein product [Amoebophrya sp. A25]|nr:unnamed protein product [Amoebophrya sp. A25]|eukprot:GSA25T00006695001.1
MTPFSMQDDCNTEGDYVWRQWKQSQKEPISDYASRCFTIPLPAQGSKRPIALDFPLTHARLSGISESTPPSRSVSSSHGLVGMSSSNPGAHGEERVCLELRFENSALQWKRDFEEALSDVVFAQLQEGTREEMRVHMLRRKQRSEAYNADLAKNKKFDGEKRDGKASSSGSLLSFIDRVLFGTTDVPHGARTTKPKKKTNAVDDEDGEHDLNRNLMNENEESEKYGDSRSRDEQSSSTNAQTSTTLKRRGGAPRGVANVVERVEELKNVTEEEEDERIDAEQEFETFLARRPPEKARDIVIQAVQEGQDPLLLETVVQLSLSVDAARTIGQQAFPDVFTNSSDTYKIDHTPMPGWVYAMVLFAILLLFWMVLAFSHAFRGH